MHELSAAARAAYEAIARSADGLAADAVPMPDRRPGARAAAIGELKNAGMIRFEAGRYKAETPNEGTAS